MASKRDYYEVLGVDRNATKEDIRKAYRKMAMQYHPDRNPNDKSAEEKFKEAAEAYEVLNNDEKKARYDRFGHEGVRTGFGSQGFTDINDIFSHFADIFSGGSIFDDIFGSGQRSGRRRTGGTPGSDLKVTLKLTLEEISEGISKKIKIKKFIRCDECNGSGAEGGSSTKTCPVCHGSGEVKTVSRSVFGQFVNIQTCNNCNGEGVVVDTPCRKCRGDGRIQDEITVKIDVPAGVYEGSYMTLRGEGNSGRKGGSAGDLLVMFQELPHEYFVRNGDDILYELFISYPDAVLGTEVEVPTFKGKAKLKIEPGTQPGKLLRMREKGIKHLNSSGHGDQLVKINIDVPKKTNSKERELLKELADSPNIKNSGEKDEKNFFKRTRF
ncbi:MAG: molecular chaperone DnaJ [Ignavibacteria bacterium GWA2_35_9]|nr:MAG: molecular chaperone DnaJ [Ignavibacteria bacterium GWA2_35_9]OGU45620.1 MAG: molecular chaperone DnaJ [Ignavibacteria bacterium GWB2_36_8]OGU49985.1 MAG: molecular chaperone DnaJ [Ignavibacteria bacterium GWC2_36_12]